MSSDFDNIKNMSIDEMVKFLDEKRKIADVKKEEIKKLKSAIESTNIKICDEVNLMDEKEEIIDKNENSDFEKEVEYYLSEFLQLKSYDKESIKEVLPSCNNYHFDNIVLRLIAEITHDIKDIKEIIITDKSQLKPDQYGNPCYYFEKNFIDSLVTGS